MKQRVWLELLSDSGIVTRSRLRSLQNEAEELLSIFVTIVKRVKIKPATRYLRAKSAKA
jgi:hypothetical protein